MAHTTLTLDRHTENPLELTPTQSKSFAVIASLGFMLKVKDGMATIIDPISKLTIAIIDRNNVITFLETLNVIVNEVSYPLKVSICTDLPNLAPEMQLDIIPTEMF